MNKKLIKTITCLVCVIGTTSAISFLSTSCGCSNQKDKALPYEVYDINETTNTLNGFKSDF